MHKDWKKLFAPYKARGWTLVDGGKHKKLIPPNGNGFVCVSRTPSTGESLRAVQKEMEYYERHGKFPDYGFRRGMAEIKKKRDEQERIPPPISDRGSGRSNSS